MSIADGHQGVHREASENPRPPGAREEEVTPDDYDYLTERERRIGKGVTWYGIVFLLVAFAALVATAWKEIMDLIRALKG